MESTPLSLAHIHARNAAKETHKTNPTAASEEHDLAAGEFANAARSTTNTEAIRTLKLLEEHHQKLAELLKFRSSDSIQFRTTTNPKSAILRSTTQNAPASPVSEQENATPHPQHLPSPIKLPHRDLSSSIASNLASARGIPSNRQKRGNQSPAQLSPQYADGRILNPPKRSRSKLSEQDLPYPEPEHEKRAMGQDVTSSAARDSAGSPAHHALSTTNNIVSQPPLIPEDTFSRFYSTFEGLLSKLSAPLGFAGLPLASEEPPKADITTEKSKHTQQPSVEPDVGRIFSKSALRAVREEHGTGTGGFGAAESFYVVPTTGGTISYAGILSRAEREARQAAGEDNDEFVDARETLQPASPNMKRKTKNPITKNMEELQLENEALRALADDLSIRLHRFEVGAQNSSMALAMSMRAFHSPTTSSAAIIHSPSAAGGGGPEKIRELEEQVATSKKEKDKLQRENDKLKTVIERYREKWEKLKDGARERMATAGKGDAGRAREVA